MLRRDLDLMSLCTVLKTWLSESADCNHIGFEERRHPLNQGRDDMAKTKGEARTNNKEKTPAKAEGDSWVKVEEEAARAKAEEEVRARVDQEAQVRAVKEDLARAQQETRVDSESEIANFQEIGKEQLKSATTSPTFFATGFQAITAETIEYSKKSLENGSAFVEKLLGAKSFQTAIHVRSEYAKTSYAALVAYLTKIGELNTKLAKEAFKRRSHVA
jgi:hypothetical protein